METGESVLVRGGTNGEMGSGLGILICKNFVSKNGGKLLIHSNVGVGTVVSTTFKKAITISPVVSKSEITSISP
jgi:signal transduction histidine kinase